MDYFAYVEIANSLLKLVIVYLLLITVFDKLILYAVLTVVVSIAIAMVYRIICIKHFKESHFTFVWKPEILKPMLAFSGWNIYGELSLVAINQGINMLLNMWFGPIMNAAVDIATRVQSIVMSLSTNVSTAMRPQIVKSYSKQEFDHMIILMRNGARITYILMLFFTIPLMIEAHYILNLWLGIVPEHSEVLLQYSLLWNLTVAVSVTLNFVVQASGDVRFQSLTSGTMYLSIIPFTYIAFLFDAPYWVPFLLKVITVFTAAFVSSHTIKKHVPNFSLSKIVIPDIFRSYAVLVLLIAITYAFTLLMEESFLRLIITTFISTVMICLLGYFVILPKEIRDKVFTLVKERVTIKQQTI